MTRRTHSSNHNRNDYNAASIEVLKGLEPVKRRPGMYTDTSRPNHLAQEVIDQDIDRDLQVDGAWLLSLCAEDLGDIDEARKALRMILRRWPKSAIVPDARKRVAELNMRIWKKRMGNPKTQ